MAIFRLGVLALGVITFATFSTTARAAHTPAQDQILGTYGQINILMQTKSYRARTDGRDRAETILNRHCADCHDSSRGEIVWWGQFPILVDMMAKDKADAQDRLDISKGFPFFPWGGLDAQSPNRQIALLSAIQKVVVEQKMPPADYRFLHGSLTGWERGAINDWIVESIGLLNLVAEKPETPLDQVTDFLERSSCLACHGNGAAMAGVSLDAADLVRYQTTDRAFIDKLIEVVGTGQMPLGADLKNPDDQARATAGVQALKQWQSSLH